MKTGDEKFSIEEAWRLLGVVCYTHEDKKARLALMIIRELVNDLQTKIRNHEGWL
jgi:hypothetical protein